MSELGDDDDDELANDAARLISISEEDQRPQERAKSEKILSQKSRIDQKLASDEIITSTNTSDTAMKHAVDCSMDVHVGVRNDDTMENRADRLLEGNEGNAQNDQVDFSATDLNNPLNILNDGEALLGSDQIRSDIADLAEPNTADAIQLLNQVEKQKRIEQYQSRSEEDSSSAGACEEDLENDSDEEDFDKEEEVLYISADSEEEDELARNLNAANISEILIDTSGLGATFAAAAESAAVGATGDASNTGTELNNAGLTKTSSSSSGSFRADSTAVASSVASSTLFGGGVLSTAGTSVTTDVTASSVASKGPTIKLVDSTPPPPPLGQPPAKKKSSKSSKKKQRALPKIPPPPPEKLKKWEDGKLRPMKHLQAVADAKAKSAQVKSEPELRARRYPSLGVCQFAIDYQCFEFPRRDRDVARSKPPGRIQCHDCQRRA